MMYFLDLNVWVCQSCLSNYYRGREVIVTDPDPEMKRVCRECLC